MQDIYRVTIHGRTLESRDLKKLLARAVSEKRNMDQRRRFYPQLQPLLVSGLSAMTLHAHAGGTGRLL